MPALLTIDTVTTQCRIRVNKGEDFNLTIPVVDANGVVVSLATGWTAVAQVYPVGGGSLLYEWSAARNNLTCTVAGVVLQFKAVETILWSWTDAEFECDVFSPTAARGIVAQGPFAAKPRLVTP